MEIWVPELIAAISEKYNPEAEANGWQTYNGSQVDYSYSSVCTIKGFIQDTYGKTWHDMVDYFVMVEYDTFLEWIAPQLYPTPP